MYVMRRTMLFLDDRLLKQLKQAARSEGRSFAAVVREALAEYVARRRGPGSRLPSIAGAYDSGRSDTAERAEEILPRFIGGFHGGSG